VLPQFFDRGGNSLVSNFDDGVSAARVRSAICFRYFDAQGEPVKSALMQRVIGIEPSSLKRDRRAARLCWRATNVRLDRFNCDQCCAVPTALHKAVTARYMKG